MSEAEVPESPASAPHPVRQSPDIERILSRLLYEGPRVKHELIYGVVKDRKTGAFHHDYATFRTSRKTARQPWKTDPKASFTLSEDKAGELSLALDFLRDCRRAPGGPAAQAGSALEPLLQALGDSAQLPALLRGLESQEPELLEAGALLFEIASARQGLRTLHQLLKNPDAPAAQLLACLRTHPWLLRGIAGPWLPLPDALLAVQPHLLLGETATGPELVLVKTPFHGQNLFIWEEALSAHTPCQALLLLLGQVQSLLEELDSQPQPGGAVQARLVLGEALQDQAQLQAVQRFNRHLQRIRIETWDMLEKQARKRLEALQQRLKQLGRMTAGDAAG